MFFFLQEKETKLVDTNAGFFIEETEGDESSSQMAEPLPAPVLEPDRPEVRFFLSKLTHLPDSEFDS